MVERFQNEFAAAAFVGAGAKRAFPVQDRGEDAMIVATKPTAAGQPITTSDDFGTVRPVTVRRIPASVQHFVAIRCNNQRPRVSGTSQDNDQSTWLTE